MACPWTMNLSTRFYTTCPCSSPAGWRCLSARRCITSNRHGSICWARTSPELEWEVSSWANLTACCSTATMTTPYIIARTPSPTRTTPPSATSSKTAGASPWPPAGRTAPSPRKSKRSGWCSPPRWCCPTARPSTTTGRTATSGAPF